MKTRDSAAKSLHTAEEESEKLDAVISVRGLIKTFGKGEAEVYALRGIDMDIERGKLTAIMGSSGSGKSTLMHCVVGLERATSGTVDLAGTRVTSLKEKELTALRRDDIGFIFQSFNLVPTLNARENIELPSVIAGKKIDKEFFHRIVRTLGLENRLKHRPSELSGGQQQRVACARAMVSKPAVVLADEPTGNLDSTATAQVLNFLRQSVDRDGQTVVMVTHEADAAAIADRVIFLEDGRIVRELNNPSRKAILDALKGSDADAGYAESHEYADAEHTEQKPEIEQRKPEQTESNIPQKKRRPKHAAPKVS